MTDEHGMPQYDGMEYEELVAASQFLWLENAKLRDMCSELYRRYWDVEGDFFIDPEIGELEGRLRKLGIETWETWE